MKVNILKFINLKKAIAITAAFFIMTIFSFSIVNISAAEIENLAVNFDTVPMYNVQLENGFNDQMNITLNDENNDYEIVQLVDGADGGDGTDANGTGSEASFKSVVNFFVKWIRRVGALVGFVGAVMFGLAIKNNDAEQKQAGLLTMVAGFAVAALCVGVDMFDIFS